MTGAPERNDFPGCPTCAYLRPGTPWFCLDCVLSAQPAPADHSCLVCGQELSGLAEECRNALCRSSTRAITRIHAITMDKWPISGPIRKAKNYQTRGWSWIFGRLVVGWLQRNCEPGTYNLIVHNPDQADPAARWLGHTAEILRSARAEDVNQTWPIVDPATPLLSLPTQVPQSRGQYLSDKQRIGTQRARVINVNWSVDGAKILIVDDVMTTGSQLDGLARRLRNEGAADVEGLVIAREPWG